MSTQLSFSKYQGTGNDFIILDGRSTVPTLTTDQIRKLCDRRFGIGADGLMILLNREGFDFEMKYYNADGKEGSMCGNGGRSMVMFAHDLGIRKDTYHFLAVDGPHLAEIDDNHWIHLKMKDVESVEEKGGHYVLNTGSPHFVSFVNDLDRLPVTDEGRSIRNSTDFVKEGINVNFVETINDHTIFVRTYERGVEAETLSCGTGVTASALMAAHNERGFNQVNVKTLGGSLSVEYERLNEHEFRNIWLCGPASFIFRGEISVTA